MSTFPASEALSGVSGSISVACWIFVLVPQLIENYKYGSAEGISLAFLTAWLIGDVTNLIGAVWAGLIPTVVALAIYFCIADAVLITQCLYYKYSNSKRDVSSEESLSNDDDPTQPLIARKHSDIGLPGSRRRSSASQNLLKQRTNSLDSGPGNSLLRPWIRNVIFVLTVCVIGAAGWAVAWQLGIWKPTLEDDKHNQDDSSHSPLGAVILGYVSAFCYLGARIPQIVKNFREKSCEGLALLFFVLSLIANLTYGGGIVFHSVSKGYLLTNLPWLIGSLGTMGEDITIFVQFHMYGEGDSATENAVA